jgi:hypothetical protein
MFPDVDFSDLSLKEAREQIGQLVEANLRANRIAVFVARDGGVVTILDPKVLTHVPIENLAGYLVNIWSDAQIEDFLTHLEKLRERL